MADRFVEATPPPGLARFFDDIAPFLLGEEDAAAARARLYPGQEHSPDAARIAIYGRFCQHHRSQVLDGVYRSLRRCVLNTRGEQAWDALVQAYFQVHPMFHAELNENGGHLAAFLAARGEALGLPAYAAALADLHWWEWRTCTAPDDPNDAAPDEGPLRLGSTVEVRPYAWDLCAWLDEGGGREGLGSPEARAVHVLFWRDPDLEARREEASLVELYVLKAVLDGEHCAPAGVPAELWRETIDDLRAAGVLLGREA